MDDPRLESVRLAALIPNGGIDDVLKNARRIYDFLVDAESSPSGTQNGKLKPFVLGNGTPPDAYHLAFEVVYSNYKETANGGKNKRGAFREWWHALRRIRKAKPDSPEGEWPEEWLEQRIGLYIASAEGRSQYSPAMAKWLKEDRFDEDETTWDRRKSGNADDASRVAGTQEDADDYSSLPVKVIDEEGSLF